ncbi:MAG: FkbM family methyltransferase [Deltaproteobacteria bacterium]|nr:FkbM family methyltransferase [Deltaproteobacteria bacterium]
MSADDLLAESRRVLRQTIDDLAALVHDTAGAGAEDQLTARLVALATRAVREQGAAATALLRGRQVAMPVRGGHLFVDLGEWTAWVVVQVHGWEVAIAQLFTRLLRPGDTAIDVGAHTGGHTLAMAAAVGAQGRVLACEPLPANIDLLQRSITASRQGAVVELLPIALGAAPGRATLYGYDPAAGAGRYPGASSMLHSLVPVRDYATDGVEVAVRTLDDLVATEGRGAAHLVKIDVEGAELQVLAGATALLQATTRAALVVEVHPTELAAQGASVTDVLALLRGHGFQLSHLVPEGSQVVVRPLVGGALHGDHVIARRS